MCKQAKKHVLYDLILPPGKTAQDITKVDLLLVGEAPGNIENVIGTPFIGRSGKLLRGILAECIAAKSIESALIANIVCCIPRPESPKTPTKVRPPNAKEIEACADHLIELVDIFQPSAIVLLGETAKQGFPKSLRSLFLSRKIPIVGTYHPAYALRSGGATSFAAAKIHCDILAAIGVEAGDWLLRETTHG